MICEKCLEINYKAKEIEDEIFYTCESCGYEWSEIKEEFDVIYCDGYTIGKNPSKIGGGYLLADKNGKQIKKEEIKKYWFTNNEGELLGVLEATRLIENGGQIFTDSQNTIKWITNLRVKARPDLKPMAIEANNNIKNKNLNLIWVRRENNLAGLLLD